MRGKKHRLIRAKMMSKGITTEDLARTAGVSYNALRAYLCSQTPWSLDAALAVCDALDIDTTPIKEYFQDGKPARGMAAKNPRRAKPAPDYRVEGRPTA